VSLGRSGPGVWSGLLETPRARFGGVFLASAQTVSQSAVPGASTPRVRRRSEAVNIDHGQLVGRHLNRFAIVMDLHELAPVDRRATGGRDGRRLERLAEVCQDLTSRGRRPVVRSPNSQRCRDGPRVTPHRTLVARQTHAEVLLAVLSFRKTPLQGGRHAFWERPAGARETGARGSRAAHLPGNAGGRSIDRAILRECGDWRGITPISIRRTIFPCGQPNSTAASIGDERRCRATSKRGSVYGC
jgi:hypothetical protein